ncbi:Flp family type IVb pilin [Sphingomonas sp.]|uniref:Flp family type IVb pilin n=1 Tax=Sphingomonas sp. TaxID=28214 RepID=UPI003B005876
MRRIRELGRNARGSTAIEYGLICALIVVVMFVGLFNLSGSVIRLYGNINNATRGAM